MKNELQRECIRLSNLKQNKNKERSIIEHSAQINLWKRAIKLTSRFGDAEDKKLAQEIFDDYLSNHVISSYNDIQNLADLVCEDVIKHKIQKEIDKVLSDKNSNFIPDKQIFALHSVQDRIWDLKEKIGIIKEDTNDDLTALQELEKKMNVYIQLNRNEFTLYAPYKCSSCGKEDVEPLLLRRRVKDFNVIKHPALSGRFLYNFSILDDVKKGLITKEQASRYLRTSSAYITWMIENEQKKIELDGIEQDKIDELVNNNPLLRNSDYYKK